MRTRERLANLLLVAVVAGVAGFAGGMAGSIMHPGAQGPIGPTGPQGSAGPPGPVPSQLGFCVWGAGATNEAFGTTNSAVDQHVSLSYCSQTGGEYVLVGP